MLFVIIEEVMGMTINPGATFFYDLTMPAKKILNMFIMKIIFTAYKRFYIYIWGVNESILPLLQLARIWKIDLGFHGWHCVELCCPGFMAMVYAWILFWMTACYMQSFRTDCSSDCQRGHSWRCRTKMTEKCRADKNSAIDQSHQAQRTEFYITWIWIEYGAHLI